MNGELLALIVKAVPEAANLIQKHKPKNDELTMLLMAQLIKENRDGFEKVVAKLDSVADIAKYTREQVEKNR